MQRVDLHPVQATPCGLAAQDPLCCTIFSAWEGQVMPFFISAGLPNKKVQTEGFDLVSVHNLVPEFTIWDF